MRAFWECNGSKLPLISDNSPAQLASVTVNTIMSSSQLTAPPANEMPSPAVATASLRTRLASRRCCTRAWFITVCNLLTR